MTGIVDIHNAQGESESTGSWTALRKIIYIKLQSEEWKTVIEAIDMSELQHLDLNRSDITHEEFKLLVDRITDNNTSKVPFKTLDITHTDIAESTESREVLKELRRKAPLVKIIRTY
ncbi:hypothetical protein BGZ65_012035 [Modicella reniformis]|uniref:Uncharacterized protein n=1 Tax=Modicella reniformis TaxID=1440133 RepID=A0A9P6SUJ9_9FUNG|nr:hypothetical protein BGZ65_012035 [Modicella reniformis]